MELKGMNLITFFLSVFLFIPLVKAYLPGDWWGTVTINDLYIADGSVVSVYVNNNITPVTTAIVGQLKNDYYLIHAEANEGNQITFKVNNILADQPSQSWSDGDHQLNISITIKDFFTNSSISTVANQITQINAMSVTNASLEILTKNDVTKGSINILKYPENPGNNNFGVISLKKYIQIEGSPEIKDNLSWIKIKIYYTDAEIMAAGISEDSLRIYYYNSTDGTWYSYEPPNGGVDTINNYVWANATHLSLFGIFGISPTTTTISTTTPTTTVLAGPTGGPGGGPTGGPGGVTTTLTTILQTTSTIKSSVTTIRETTTTISQGIGIPTGEVTKPTTSPMTGFVTLLTSPFSLGIIVIIVVTAFGVVYWKYYFRKK